MARLRGSGSGQGNGVRDGSAGADGRGSVEGGKIRKWDRALGREQGVRKLAYFEVVFTGGSVVLEEALCKGGVAEEAGVGGAGRKERGSTSFKRGAKRGERGKFWRGREGRKRVIGGVVDGAGTEAFCCFEEPGVAGGGRDTEGVDPRCDVLPGSQGEDAE